MSDEVEVLSREECLALLGRHHAGRIAGRVAVRSMARGERDRSLAMGVRDVSGRRFPIGVHENA
jgi:hypothetical protein